MYTSDLVATFPNEDVLSWVFQSDVDESEPIWIDSVNDKNVITAGLAKKTILQLIAGFHARGVGVKDAVCVHAFNNIWYPLAYLAIIGAGASFVGSNPAYKVTELRRLFNVSKPRCVFVDLVEWDRIRQVARDAGVLDSNIFIFDADQRSSAMETPLHSWRELLQNKTSSWHRFNDEQLSKTTAACLLTTSGTGGLPKIASMSHHALIAQAVLAAGLDERLPHKVRRLISLPFWHSFVLPYHLTALRSGQRTYVMSRFHAQDFASSIHKYQITDIPIVPPMARDLFTPPLSAAYSYASLREVTCAGAALGRDLQRTLATALPASARFCQLWGMSELGWVTAFMYPETDDTGSVGRLLPGTNARQVNSEGEEISEDDEAGEIFIQNQGIMSGYLSNDVATRESMSNGWLRTGDVGYCKDGKWYIVDRAKDLIKVRGWQVSAAEIEACLLGLPGVRDVAVVRRCQEEGGEVPAAYVVPERTEAPPVLSEERVKQFVQEHLASYKSLDGGVTFVEEIPRTASGKILRHLL